MIGKGAITGTSTLATLVMHGLEPITLRQDQTLQMLHTLCGLIKQFLPTPLTFTKLKLLAVESLEGLLGLYQLQESHPIRIVNCVQRRITPTSPSKASMRIRRRLHMADE
jgi:hypothetical protein